MVGNTSIALIRFTQDTVTGKDGGVSIEIINLTGESINECQIFIEMCDGIPSINSCQNQYVYTISQLSENESQRRVLPFRGIQLSTVNINVGIVSTSKRSTYLSNVYDESFIKFVNRIDNLSDNGTVKGVVFADGKAMFRLSLGDNNYYNITGTFIDTSYFNNGLLFSQVTTTAPFTPASNVALQSVVDKKIFFKYPESDTVRFGLQLNSRLPVPAPLSFADSIIFTLIKH